MPKVQKVAQLMKELGLGRHDEKISWREYPTFKLKGKKGVEESRPCGVDAPTKEEYQGFLRRTRIALIFLIKKFCLP
jgi:hypothetical protein